MYIVPSRRKVGSKTYTYYNLVEGVRIHHDDAWALVLPDPEEPTTSVIAEASSEPEATRLADEYVRRIEQLIRR